MIAKAVSNINFFIADISAITVCLTPAKHESRQLYTTADDVQIKHMFFIFNGFCYAFFTRSSGIVGTIDVADM
jgi:hypothetical protein